jgi:hypothetical protein
MWRMTHTSMRVVHVMRRHTTVTGWHVTFLLGWFLGLLLVALFATANSPLLATNDTEDAIQIINEIESTIFSELNVGYIAALLLGMEL